MWEGFFKKLVKISWSNIHLKAWSYAFYNQNQVVRSHPTHIHQSILHLKDTSHFGQYINDRLISLIIGSRWLGPKQQHILQQHYDSHMGKNDTMRNDLMKHFVPAGGQISLDLSPIVNRLWRLLSLCHHFSEP